MTIHEAQRKLLFQLYHLYEEREAAAIADLVMEHLTGWKKIDRIVNRSVSLSVPTQQTLEAYTTALLSSRPVQYVLGEAWFFGAPFFVDEHVLIPRPETEELVHWAVGEARLSGGTPRILDLGTGSGCIPVTIKKKLPGSTVFACDISREALQIAGKNAERHGADIHFLQVDLLDKNQWEALPAADIIISNPPYIPESEKQSMEQHVVQYEPHLALFVTDAQPLLFYEAVSGLATIKLSEKGCIFVEMHEKLARATAEVFHHRGFHTEIRRDMQGKNRMLKAWR